MKAYARFSVVPMIFMVITSFVVVPFLGVQSYWSWPSEAGQLTDYRKQFFIQLGERCPNEWQASLILPPVGRPRMVGCSEASGGFAFSGLASYQDLLCNGTDVIF